MIKYFIDNPKVVVLLMIGVVLAGVLSLFQLRKEAFPNVDFATAKIITYYPGATSEDVELLVTKKIEDEIREVDGLKEVRSISQEGYSEIKVKVDLDRSDTQDVLDEVQRAVSRVPDLPEELPDPPLFEELKTQNTPIVEVSVVGAQSELELRRYAKQLEEEIELVEGVAEGNLIGYRDREFRIYADPLKMRSLHIGFGELVQAIRAQNVNVPGGVFESRPLEKSVRTIGEFEEATDINNVVVRTNLSGQVIRVSDIARVEDTFEKGRVIAKTNGKKSIVLVITKKEQADILTLTDRVKKKLESFEKRLPSYMSLVLSNDESTRTRNRLDILLNNAVIGFVLVVLALLVFLDWRTALVTSISVPIVILATLAAMDAWGITFNLISMLAVIIALGMFVDNSIVISENIFRLKQEGYSNKEAAYKGVKEIAAPITATVATTIAAFLPMFVTAGIMGRFIWAIPAVVSSSLIISLFDSFFLLPTRILAIGGTVEQTGSHWFGKIRKSFERQLHFLVKHRWVSLGLAVSLLVGSVAYAIFGLNFILFPPEGVDRFIVRYEAKAGVPIERVHEEISKVERAILELPETELRALVTRTGIQQTQPNDPLAQTGDQVGMITVYLTPENDRKRVADEIIAELKEKAPTYGVFKSIQYEKIANGPPVGKPITLSVQGGDIDRLKEIAADITGTLSNIEGVTDINQDLKPGLKQLRVKLKPRAQELHGLTVNDVAQAVRTAHEGRVASVLNRFDEDIDIRVLFPTEARGDRKTLSGLLIEDRRGNLIPLEKVASVIEEPGPVARRHFQFQRSVTVTAEVDTEVITSVEANNQVRQAYSDFENTFSGYSLKFGGEEESTQESLVSLRNAMVIAAVAIFGILVALFSSFSKPLLIMFSIPFGMIGTVVGFALHQKALGFLAMIGIIGLAGVVVNSAIVLISFIELLRYQEGKPLLQAVVEGASMRLRPVLLTSVTTVSALFPTAYGLGGWDPTLVPMTLAMAWGLLFGTALTLIVVPCGYMAIEDILRLVGRDKTPDQAYQTASF